MIRPFVEYPINIGEMFIWESSNLLLLVPVAVGLVILVVLASQKSGIHGGQDWLLRFGQSREGLHTASSPATNSGSSANGLKPKKPKSS
jgi:hypothetical protein